MEGTVLKDVAGFKLDGVKITIGVEDFDKPGLSITVVLETQNPEFFFVQCKCNKEG